MATTTTDLISASRGLDPASRALLNLWLHRGLDDLAIAHLSGGSAEEVAERRRRLVDRLAQEVGSPPEEVRAVLDGMAGQPRGGSTAPQARVEPLPRRSPRGELLLPGDDAEHSPGNGKPDLIVPGRAEPPGSVEIFVPITAEVETDDDPANAGRELVVAEAPGAPSPAARRAEERELERRRRPAPAPRSSPFPAALGFALGAIIVAMVAVAALSGGSSSSGGGSEPAAASPTASATAAQAAPAPTPTPLEPLPGVAAGIGGSVASDGPVVELSVTGLERPEADYEVWLFNSITDAESLGRLDAGSFRLPPERRRFRYLEVSLEPRAERKPAHSGRTVLRTRVPG